MVTMLTRNWWTLALRGLVAVMFGIAALVWPQPTLELLVMVFGAVMLVDGVLALVAGSAARWWAPALVGVVEIIIGAATLISPATAGLILLALIAAWAVTTGILQVMVAVQLRREIDNEWLVALGGILSIAFGVFVVLFPGASAIGLVWLIGAYAILEGLSLIAFGFRVRSLHKDAEIVEQSVFGDAA